MKKQHRPRKINFTEEEISLLDVLNTEVRADKEDFEDDNEDNPTLKIPRSQEREDLIVPIAQKVLLFSSPIFSTFHEPIYQFALQRIIKEYNTNNKGNEIITSAEEEIIKINQQIDIRYLIKPNGTLDRTFVVIQESVDGTEHFIPVRVLYIGEILFIIDLNSYPKNEKTDLNIQSPFFVSLAAQIQKYKPLTHIHHIKCKPLFYQAGDTMCTIHSAEEAIILNKIPIMNFIRKTPHIEHNRQTMVHNEDLGITFTLNEVTGEAVPIMLRQNPQISSPSYHEAYKEFFFQGYFMEHFFHILGNICISPEDAFEIGEILITLGKERRENFKKDEENLICEIFIKNIPLDINNTIAAIGFLKNSIAYLQFTGKTIKPYQNLLFNYLIQEMEHTLKIQEKMRKEFAIRLMELGVNKDDALLISLFVFDGNCTNIYSARYALSQKDPSLYSIIEKSISSFEEPMLTIINKRMPFIQSVLCQPFSPQLKIMTKSGEDFERENFSFGIKQPLMLRLEQNTLSSLQATAFDKEFPAKLLELFTDQNLHILKLPTTNELQKLKDIELKQLFIIVEKTLKYNRDSEILPEILKNLIKTLKERKINPDYAEIYADLKKQKEETHFQTTVKTLPQIKRREETDAKPKKSEKRAETTQEASNDTQQLFAHTPPPTQESPRREEHPLLGDATEKELLKPKDKKIDLSV